VAGIKIIVDGTIDGCTAAMINPYTNGTNDDGIWDLVSLTRVVTAADAAGLQIALHAIGDQAVRNAIASRASAPRNETPTGGRKVADRPAPYLVNCW
jgi:predicted amidohydrolase YtcJ